MQTGCGANISNSYESKQVVSSASDLHDSIWNDAAKTGSELNPLEKKKSFTAELFIPSVTELK